MGSGDHGIAPPGKDADDAFQRARASAVRHVMHPSPCVAVVLRVLRGEISCWRPHRKSLVRKGPAHGAAKFPKVIRVLSGNVMVMVV